MPRRSSKRNSSTPAINSQEYSIPPETNCASENTLKLRQQWKWAAFSQFFHIFLDLFAINDISITDIENDLVQGTDIFLPRIVQRLLFTVSYDRKISSINWQDALRKQYDKREPAANPLGPYISMTASSSRLSSVLKEAEGEEREGTGIDSKEASQVADTEVMVPTEPDDTSSKRNTEEPPSLALKTQNGHDSQQERYAAGWSDLSMIQKLECLHTLVEWQFHNPLRLRSIMKSDDENALWRPEPVGYDKLQNTYWLIGGNRLWIQRVPPKPATRKRKRKEASRDTPKSRKVASRVEAKRQRLQGSHDTNTPNKLEPPNNSRGRAAKEQAKAKLGAQAKELAEFLRQSPVDGTGSSSRKTKNYSSSKLAPQTRRPAGVRMSARLRGAQDDGWQPVPDEWLNGHEPPKKPRTGLESDVESISDLTELSDDNPSEPKVNDSPVPMSTSAQPLPEEAGQDEPPADFIEWETICVTLEEWEHIADRFANSTHYTEKAFYRYLTDVLVPEVTAELKQIEQKRRLEEALMHRKRSSRIAHRETEKESARLAAQRHVEEEEKLSRTRRLEARQQREEAERLKREHAREQRRANRESRLKEEKEIPPSQANQTTLSDRSFSKSTFRLDERKTNSGSRTPATDDWELDCEICGKRGKNIDDGTPMMCCGVCSKWQHIECHDQRDLSLGRPKRNWDSIEFFCQRCISPKSDDMRRPASSSQTQQAGPPPALSHHMWQNATFQDSQSPSFSMHESFPYSQPSLAPTSNLRSSTYLPQPPYVSQYQPTNISFSHYQPQARAFTTDPGRVHLQQNPYFRTNGPWPSDVSKYQPHALSQPIWNQNTPSQHANPPPFTQADGIIVNNQTNNYHHHPPLEASAHRPYESRASQENYQQSFGTPPVSYNRTPYPPRP